MAQLDNVSVQLVTSASNQNIKRREISSDVFTGDDLVLPLAGGTISSF